MYTRDDAAALLEGTGLDIELAADVEGKIMSGFVRATKPGRPQRESEARAPTRITRRSRDRRVTAAVTTAAAADESLVRVLI